MIKSSLNVLTGAFSFMPKDFNSHARVGRDLIDDVIDVLIQISTHTPV